MKKILMFVGLILLIVLAYNIGCTQESREETMNRLSKAGKALSGELRPDDVDHSVPNIVAEQQRKERVRQNTSWTAENRALHPVEYCQSQLMELERFSARLEVTAHEVATRKAEVTRVMNENEGRMKHLEKFLREAKTAYRTCEANNSWPSKLGGFSLSREKVREKIVDAAQKIPSLEARVGSQRNQLTHLEKKAELVLKEQKQLVALRERIEATISDLKLAKVIDGERGIVDALNAINDAMGSLGVDHDDPSLDDVLSPGRKTSISSDFEKIMSKE